MTNVNNCVCVGDLMVELYIPNSYLPPIDTTSIFNKIDQHLGGPAYNISSYLSKLNVKVKLIGVYGKNNTPLIINNLVMDNIKKSHLVSIKGNTDYLISFITQQHYRSLYLLEKIPNNISQKIIDRCGKPNNLIITGSRHSLIRKTQNIIAENFKGKLFLFNPSYAIYEYNKNDLIKLLRKANISVFNNNEIKFALKRLQINTVDALYRNINKILIITLGKKGIKLYMNNTLFIFNPVTYRNINKIGAGDAFTAGLLYGILNNKDIIDAVYLGLALTTFVFETKKIKVPVLINQLNKKYRNIRNLIYFKKSKL